MSGFEQEVCSHRRLFKTYTSPELRHLRFLFALFPRGPEKGDFFHSFRNVHNFMFVSLFKNIIIVFTYVYPISGCDL